MRPQFYTNILILNLIFRTRSDISSI